MSSGNKSVNNTGNAKRNSNYLKYGVYGIIFVLVVAGIAIGVDNALNVAAQASTTITAYYVPNAQIDLGHPGQEFFWSSIPWTTVPLVPTVPAPGSIAGHTTSIKVKMAWTYVDGVPYIIVLTYGVVLGTQNEIATAYQSPSGELTPQGRIWAPFNFFPTSTYFVNITYNTADESHTNVYSVPISYQEREISYPPGQTMGNPVTIYVNTTDGELTGWVSGAIDVYGNPLNNGLPIEISSINITANIPGRGMVHVTSLQQFVSDGLNNTIWAQAAYNLFYPEDTAEYVNLYHNDTYVYPLRVAVMWDLGGVPNTWFKVAYTPHMVLGTSGAISAGSVEVWHWNSNPRSNNTLDLGYAGILRSLSGASWTLANYTHCPSYQDPLELGYLPHQGMVADMYVNGSSIYYIGGIPFITTFPALNNPTVSNWDWLQGNYTPSELWNPSVVATGDSLSVAPNGQTYLSLEFARTFSTKGVSSCLPGGGGESNYQVQLSPGQVYHVAFAWFQGAIGESVDFKSISLWWNVYIQPPNGAAHSPLQVNWLFETMVPIIGALVVYSVRNRLVD
ncbi:MAG: ethylbenzene dehydrogenase [Thermoprotei archaeon]